jgi:hypothetical protein
MFDDDFDRFITPSAIKWVYVLGLVLLGLVGVGFTLAVIKSFQGEEQPFIAFGWILGVVASVALLGFLLRLWCESVIVRFEVAETLKDVRDALRGEAGDPENS